MKTSFYLIILCSIFILSCKNEPQKSQLNKETEQISTSKKLTVRWKFKTDKQDVFRIMLNNIQVDEFQKKNIHIIEDVPPSRGYESIIAIFDADNISNNLVFSLGNKKVKTIDIESIILSFGKNEIGITSYIDFEKYFVVNKFIVKDSTANILKTKKLNGKHNPSFFAKKNLINLLKRE